MRFFACGVAAVRPQMQSGFAAPRGVSVQQRPAQFASRNSITLTRPKIWSSVTADCAMPH